MVLQNEVRKENRVLFEEMLDRFKKEDYVDCAANKGFLERLLLLILLFEQQKMINELLRKVGMRDRIQNTMLSYTERRKKPLNCYHDLNVIF